MLWGRGEQREITVEIDRLCDSDPDLSQHSPPQDSWSDTLSLEGGGGDGADRDGPRDGRECARRYTMMMIIDDCWSLSIFLLFRTELHRKSST